MIDLFSTKGKTLNFRFCLLSEPVNIRSVIRYSTTSLLWEIAAWLPDVVAVISHLRKGLQVLLNKIIKKIHLFHYFNEFLNEGGFLTLFVLVWLSKLAIWCDLEFHNRIGSRLEMISWLYVFSVTPFKIDQDEKWSEVIYMISFHCSEMISYHFTVWIVQ